MEPTDSNVIYIGFGGFKTPDGSGSKKWLSKQARKPDEKRKNETEPSASAKTFTGYFVDFYSRSHVSRILGIKEGRLLWWDRSGFIKPSRRMGKEKYYSFEDIILLKAACTLIEQGCSTKQIRTAITRLSNQLPASPKPLMQMKVVGNDKQLIIQHKGRKIEASTGQVTIDFSISQVAEEVKNLIIASKETKTSTDPATSHSEAQAEQLFRKAISYEEKKERQNAKQLYKKVLKINPQHGAALTNLGNIALQEGDIQNAELLYREAIKADPSLPQPYYNLGCLKLSEERYDISIVFLKKSLHLDPHFSHVHLNLGIALMKEGRKKEAQIHLNKFIELAEKEETYWIKIAHSYLKSISED